MLAACATSQLGIEQMPRLDHQRCGKVPRIGRQNNLLEGFMRKLKMAITLLGTFCILAIGWLTARSQAAKTVQVHMVITDMALRTEKSLPALNAKNVKV